MRTVTREPNPADAKQRRIVLRRDKGNTAATLIGVRDRKAKVYQGGRHAIVPIEDVALVYDATLDDPRHSVRVYEGTNETAAHEAAMANLPAEVHLVDEGVWVVCALDPAKSPQ